MPINVSHLSYTYSKNGPFKKDALRDVSFDIDDGSFVGIIGHTGSGKSTLIQHLNGLIKPDAGSVVIDGVNITEPGADMRKIRSKVGLVFQYPEYQLFEETVYKDIAYGPSNLGMDFNTIDRLIHESIEFVGLGEDVLEKSPFELSGGQKRRGAIAGVLAMNPSILILDEPTAGLDPIGRRDILARLKTLHETKKITVMLVSHSMEDIAATVDKVIVMSNGRLAAFGTVPEIFSNSDLLKDAGLDVPQVCTVANVLRKDGFDISGDIYTVEKAADEIYNYIKGAKNA